jgi:NAD(P)-dependent dehydrogenase (short-subunit alcohol dehydrogenase family)
LLQIDVSSESSILAAAKQVEEKYARVDALVNNAAISGNDPDTASLFSRLTAAFQTNATGPAIVVETFVPLLDKSNKVVRIVNVTSGAGSISLRLGDPHEHQKMKTLPYRASKAALNMLMACQAYEYGERGWKVFCFCPGFTESGLSPMVCFFFLLYFPLFFLIFILRTCFLSSLLFASLVLGSC